jgi:catechol 2,3-dioxygenase-like lactoylglutathione lyase family enzyme
MSLIIGLDHVNLLIDAGDDALSRARAFYEGLLGLEPLERPANTDSGNPGAWYQCGVQQLHLTTEKDASSVNRKSRRHPAFRVANLEALRKKQSRATDSPARSVSSSAIHGPTASNSSNAPRADQ